MVSKLGTRIILKFLSSASPVNFSVKQGLCPQINLLPEDSLIGGLVFFPGWDRVDLRDFKCRVGCDGRNGKELGGHFVLWLMIENGGPLPREKEACL